MREELLEDVIERLGVGFTVRGKALRKELLNGASSWKQFSEGGCSLAYDGDIAHRLCSPSELKRVYGKRGYPREVANARGETWIEVQARALQQAEWVIKGALKRMEDAR